MLWVADKADFKPLHPGYEPSARKILSVTQPAFPSGGAGGMMSLVTLTAHFAQTLGIGAQAFLLL
ncbi:hypothetical protein AM218_13285 [Hymenobacter sp. DG25A]|nr:hypothetical protein AM218_13285 [Hymenobacter sp. DG25A]